MQQNGGLFSQLCFEHYYAHHQEYISEYRFLVSKPISRLGCLAQSC
jgi:hypothetical protein